MAQHAEEAADGPAATPGEGVYDAAAVPPEFLRPAVEEAWRLVRAEANKVPPVEPPGPLRPLLSMPRLSSKRALADVRRAVEADDGLRRRVAAAVSEASVGRAAWLWLARPDGWDRELVDLVEAAGARRRVETEVREERAAARRLAAAEQKLAVAEGRLTATGQQAEALAGELRAERQRADRAERRIGHAESAAATARQRAEEAAHQAAAATACADELTGRLADAEGARDRLVAEVASLRGALEAAGARASAAEAARDEAVTAATSERTAAGRSLADAARAAGALASALAAAASSLGAAPVPAAPVRTPGEEPRRPSTSGSDGIARPAPGRPHSATRGAAPGRRTPVAVPPGVFDDTVEWAERLVRTRGALLLVDGYNVTLSSWPGVRLPDQRRTLVDALVELHLRTGVDVHVVFDAHPVEDMQPSRSGVREVVRCSFSPVGEDADEVLIDLVDATEAVRAVIVATDDQRVRGEVRARGANVISVTQLLGLLGRRPRR